MDQVEQYKLNEAKQQDRLSAFMADANGCDLSRELSVARLMLESAMANNQSMLARDLLGSIAALSKAHQLALQQRKELIDRPTMLGVVRLLTQIIVDRLSHVPGHEDIIDAIADDFGRAIDQSRMRQLPAPSATEANRQ